MCPGQLTGAPYVVGGVSDDRFEFSCYTFEEGDRAIIVRFLKTRALGEERVGELRAIGTSLQDSELLCPGGVRLVTPPGFGQAIPEESERCCECHA